MTIKKVHTGARIPSITDFWDKDNPYADTPIEVLDDVWHTCPTCGQSCYYDCTGNSGDAAVQGA